VIILKKLRYQNFMSTGNYFTELDLNKSKTTLICGRNGSGKCIRGSTEIDIIFDDPEVQKKFLETIKN